MHTDYAYVVHKNPIPHHEHCFLFFPLFFSYSVCLDSLAIIVLECPYHSVTFASNCATCKGQIRELISNLPSWDLRIVYDISNPSADFLRSD